MYCRNIHCILLNLINKNTRYAQQTKKEKDIFLKKKKNQFWGQIIRSDDQMIE